MEYTESDVQILNDWVGFGSFVPNFIVRALSNCDAKIVFVDKGNQGGGTASVIYDYILRILGQHPVEKKNIRPNTAVRTIRFASETLPTEAEGEGEIRNTLYPQFKKFFPPYLIKKDITARRPALTLRDYQGGKDIILEFVSYNQEVQSQAGVQRFSCYCDEQPPQSFYEEQLPRLLAADGDLIIALTPAENLSWVYEAIYLKANWMYNSDTIISYLDKKTGVKHESKEFLNSGHSIAVIRAATDDNPTLNPQVIENQFAGYDDEQAMEVRRYGIFHQISGVIFKEFDPRIHVLNRNQHFPEGIPHSYIHGRGIDFHEQTNWAILWLALTRENEVFVYDEWNPSPSRYVTVEIAREIAMRSRDYKFAVNLIDPWAAKKQANTGFSPIDDLNRAFGSFRRDIPSCTGGYWETWDTKNLRGRDMVKERLKNARLVGKPFNNRMIKNGENYYLPTMWVLNNCEQTIFSMRNWRWDEWATRESSLTKDEKNKPQDRFSHFPVTIECIFKHPAFSMGMYKGSVIKQKPSPYRNYMRV